MTANLRLFIQFFLSLVTSWHFFPVVLSNSIYSSCLEWRKLSSQFHEYIPGYFHSNEIPLPRAALLWTTGWPVIAAICPTSQASGVVEVRHEIACVWKNWPAYLKLMARSNLPDAPFIRNTAGCNSTRRHFSFCKPFGAPALIGIPS
jgi:hypothetical protein